MQLVSYHLEVFSLVDTFYWILYSYANAKTAVKIAIMSVSELKVDSIVKIDNSGEGKIVSVSETASGTIYSVQIEGIDFVAKLTADRVSLVAKQTTAPPTGLTDGDENADCRFVVVADDDIDKFVEKQANKKTLSKTRYDVKLVETFFKREKEERSLQDIPPEVLAPLLCKFFIGVRKSDGSQYEPNTLRSFLSSFERHLKKHDYPSSLINDREFDKLREVLKSKQMDLKRAGKGNLPNKADPITDEEIEILWQRQQFGLHTPDSIINTLWFVNTVHFGLRAADEHRYMCWGDVTLRKDSNKQEYLMFDERQTKTRSGANPRDVRTVTPKMWSKPETPDRCPVQVYKKYAEKRPSDYSDIESPFYIATHTRQTHMGPDDQWFLREPIGVNKLGSLMTRMSKAAGLAEDKKLRNHSARKHLVQKLNDNNVPPTQIMQITGHRNVQSVNNYCHLNNNQHREISQILSTPTPQYAQQYPRILPRPTPPAAGTLMMASTMNNTAATDNSTKNSASR